MSHRVTGLRGRVALLVLAVTACLYSALGTFGVLRVADSGREATRDRIEEVLDQLEQGLLEGSTTVRIVTADGVEAVAAPIGRPPEVPTGDITVRRERTIGATQLLLVGHASQARLADSVRSFWRGVWIVVPIASVLTALAAGYATGRALRPVDEIAALAGALGPHDTTTRVPLPDTGDEIEHLARTVNAMLDRIADGRRAQQRFTSDAAHELRTPLMALQCEIELAADDPAAIDPALRERITALLARLSTCTDDLLLLSTLDEGRPVAQAPVDLAALLRSEVDALPRGRHLTLHVTDLSVLGDEPLLRRAVANVLANATRHAATTVEVGLVAQDGTVCVHVDDDGPGIDAEARVRVLDRFARLDEARGPGGGAGLGLSIAAAVVERHGGEVSIATSPLGGARVSFRFPSPPPFCLEQKCAAAGDAGRTMGAC